MSCFEERSWKELFYSQQISPFLYLATRTKGSRRLYSSPSQSISAIDHYPCRREANHRCPLLSVHQAKHFSSAKWSINIEGLGSPFCFDIGQKLSSLYDLVQSNVFKCHLYYPGGALHILNKSNGYSVKNQTYQRFPVFEVGVVSNSKTDFTINKYIIYELWGAGGRRRPRRRPRTGKKWKQR